MEVTEAGAALIWTGSPVLASDDFGGCFNVVSVFVLPVCDYLIVIYGVKCFFCVFVCLLYAGFFGLPGLDGLPGARLFGGALEDVFFGAVHCGEPCFDEGDADLHGFEFQVFVDSGCRGRFCSGGHFAASFDLPVAAGCGDGGGSIFEGGGDAFLFHCDDGPIAAGPLQYLAGGVFRGDGGGQGLFLADGQMGVFQGDAGDGMAGYGDGTGCFQVIYRCGDGGFPRVEGCYRSFLCDGCYFAVCACPFYRAGGGFFSACFGAGFCGQLEGFGLSAGGQGGGGFCCEARMFWLRGFFLVCGLLWGAGCLRRVAVYADEEFVVWAAAGCVVFFGQCDRGGGQYEGGYEYACDKKGPCVSYAVFHACWCISQCRRVLYRVFCECRCVLSVMFCECQRVLSVMFHLRSPCQHNLHL